MLLRPTKVKKFLRPCEWLYCLLGNRAVTSISDFVNVLPGSINIALTDQLVSEINSYSINCHTCG